jgi:glycine betaine catabolism B
MGMASEYVRVASTSDIPEGKMKMVQVGSAQVCLAHLAGRYDAIGNLCTHVGGPLAQGVLKDFVVTCPWHGSQFDVRTGEVKHGPAVKPEPTYEVKVEGTNILVRPR